MADEGGGFGEVNLALNLSDESKNDQNVLDFEEVSLETLKQPEKDKSAVDVAKESAPGNEDAAGNEDATGNEDTAENEDDKEGEFEMIGFDVKDNGSEGGEGRIVEKKQGIAENEDEHREDVKHDAPKNEDNHEGDSSRGHDNETFEDSEKKVEDKPVDGRDANEGERQDQQNKQLDRNYLDADANSNYSTSDAEEPGDHLKRWETTHLEIQETPKGEKKEKNEKFIDGEKKNEKSKASPFKKAFFLSKYITFW